MREKDKIARKMVEEFVWLKEKEIQMLKKLKEDRTRILPHEEREHTVRVIAEIIQEIKEELETYYWMRERQGEVLYL